MPALHGPEGSEPVTGPVIGFVLAADDAPTLYVSGDNASVDVVRDDRRALGPDRARGPLLRRRQPAAAASTAPTSRSRPTPPRRRPQVLGARAVVPVHFEGWAHFTQGADELRAAFAAAGIADRLVVPEPGASVSV